MIFAQIIIGGTFGYLYEFKNHWFTEQFCENQDNTELHCNGLCAMKKAQKSSSNKILNLCISFPQFTESIPFFDFDNQIEITEVKKESCFYSNLYLFLFSKENIDPPSLV